MSDEKVLREIGKMLDRAINKSKQPLDCSSIADLFRYFIETDMQNFKNDDWEKYEKIYRYFTGDNETEFKVSEKDELIDKLMEVKYDWDIEVKRVEKKNVK